MSESMKSWKIILKYLDTATLKVFLNLSKEFRESIIKSPELMRKIPIVLCEHSSWRDLIPFLEKYGEHVMEMKFLSVSLHELEDVGIILKFTPNLENLCCRLNFVKTYVNADGDIIYGIFEEEIKEDCIDFKLGKLKVVSIESPEKIVLMLIKALKHCVNIEEFNLSTTITRHEQIIGEFLEHQNNLKKLSIEGSSDNLLESIFTRSLVDRKFQLRALKLDCELDKFYPILSEFLNTQTDSLEELEIPHYGMNFHYFRLILKCVNLRKLIINFDGMFNGDRIAEIRNIRLPNVTYVEFKDFQCEFTVFEVVLGLFPNIEVLNTRIIYFSLHGILDNFPKLRKIISSEFRVELLSFAKSQSLKQLDVNITISIRDTFFWDHLAKNIPNIENLTIKYENNRKLLETTNMNSKALLKSLKSFKKLKQCRITDPFSQTVYINLDEDSDDKVPVLDEKQPYTFILDIVLKEIFATRNFLLEHSQDLKELSEIFEIKEIVEISM
ncbi:CLUMA_CG007808, isoform A [Clunio marinus]|uniref:CLUMA_CG007808, isoform A n=1 Tax=Clunio marinus TaxID=568069 RepID=A0A1J1I1X6_9DIPT|nr:CLUMA_CG007808, isoform A [Clunio marinus]